MIYNINGLFVISSRGVWLPGVYATKEAAQFAFQFDYETLKQLREKSSGAITSSMLKDKN